MKLTSFLLALGVAYASASPVSESSDVNIAERAPQGGDNCQNFLGDCYSNGCEPVFANPADTVGTCNSGSFNGCPCEKCGGTSGGFTGGCSDNGCAGIQGVCQGGNYQGCPCN